MDGFRDMENKFIGRFRTQDLLTSLLVKHQEIGLVHQGKRGIIGHRCGAKGRTRCIIGDVTEEMVGHNRSIFVDADDFWKGRTTLLSKRTDNAGLRAHDAADSENESRDGCTHDI